MFDIIITGFIAAYYSSICWRQHATAELVETTCGKVKKEQVIDGDLTCKLRCG